MPHASYPQPGCPNCESMAVRAGHASVTAFLALREPQPESRPEMLAA